MLRMVGQLGRGITAIWQVTGENVKLSAALVCHSVKEARYNVPDIMAQMARVGAETLPIASLTALFIGMVLALQSGDTLERFGLAESLGALVPLAMVREMGPVFLAVLLAGRVGAGFAAELGTMTVSEEIDALRTLGIDPVRYLGMPRFLACIAMAPLLVVYFDLIGIFGRATIARAFFDVSYVSFFDSCGEWLTNVAVLKSLVKAAIFGAIIATVGCREGFATAGGPAGVGRATTAAVVRAFVTIFIANYFITSLWL